VRQSYIFEPALLYCHWLDNATHQQMPELQFDLLSSHILYLTQHCFCLLLMMHQLTFPVSERKLLHLAWKSCGLKVNYRIFSIDSSVVAADDSFVHLGNLQSTNRYCNPALRHCLCLASFVMASLQRMQKDQHISAATKIHVYTSVLEMW